MSKIKIYRRDFSRTSVMVTIPLTIGGLPMFALNRSSSSLFDGDNDKILVFD